MRVFKARRVGRLNRCWVGVTSLNRRHKEERDDGRDHAVEEAAPRRRSEAADSPSLGCEADGPRCTEAKPRQIASKKAPRGPGGVFSTKPRPSKANMPSANTVLVPISDEARPFAPSSRPKQKYPSGAGKETSSSCHYMPPYMPSSVPPPQPRPRPTS